MKKTIILAATLVLTSLAVMSTFAATGVTGNGAPNGPHWNLNIIGVQKGKSMPDGLGGGVIFVGLGKTGESVISRINLVPGPDFAVLDKDGTDGSATLQLMDPFPDDVSPGINTGEQAVYKIYIRALGKPGGSAIITSGFTDEYGTDWLSLESVVATRTKGQMKFDDKTLELTTILVDLNGDGIAERYNLFGNPLWDYFWQYDNSGLKLLQMRIYLVSS